MILWLVRHTKTTVPDGICYGRTDVDIAAGFDDEAAPLVQSIRTTAPSLVYSSPLRRCRALAELIGPARLDARLTELDFGRWEMRPWTSIDAAEIEQWRERLAEWVVPEGESVGQMAARAGAFLDELRQSGAACACVVTHAGVIRVLSCLLWKQDLGKALDVGIPVSGALKIDWDETGARLLELHGCGESRMPDWVL